jgi:hypothetical protein
MIARLLLALVVFIATGLILAEFLPPILTALFAGIALVVVIAGLFAKWGWILAACIAVWFFFAGGAVTFTWPWRKP